jgi:hypothetical protein
VYALPGYILFGALIGQAICLVTALIGRIRIKRHLQNRGWPDITLLLMSMIFAGAVSVFCIGELQRAGGATYIGLALGLLAATIALAVTHLWAWKTSVVGQLKS